MQPEKLSEKASRIAQDAKNILEIVDRFEPAFEKLWRNPIRLSVVLEIDKAKQLVMEKVEKENKDTTQYPATYGNNEIWIYTYNDGFFHDLSVNKNEEKICQVGGGRIVSERQGFPSRIEFQQGNQQSENESSRRKTR